MQSSSAKAVPATETAPSTDAPILGVTTAGLEEWAQKTAPADHKFDEYAAAKACAFFPKYLRHTKGKWAGQPFHLEPWQRDLVRTLFGWKRPDGTRRFRICYVEIPRKNGKTTLAAGIALYLTFADGEIGAEVYSVANDTDQAAICHSEAKRMRAQSQELAREIPFVFKHAIANARRGQAYRVLSSSAGNKDGLNVHGCIMDEFHAMVGRELYDVMHTAQGARQQPVEFIITTAGVSRLSICWTTRDYAIKVRDGTVEDAEFLPCIFAAEQDDDWTDPRVWAKANPGLGRTVPLEYLAKECKRAKEQPAAENAFRRLHLNQWTEQSTRWLPMDKWRACKGAVDWTELPALLAKRRGWIGLDLANTQDVAAAVGVFPDAEGVFDILCKFYIPEDRIAERVRRDRVPYDVWKRQGAIVATPGNIIDYAFIRRDLNAWGKDYDIREIGFDPWNADSLTTQLREEDGFVTVPMRQGFHTMAEPTKRTGDLVVAGLLRHGGHPVLEWMASNMVVRLDANANMAPDKSKATEKIDGIVALIMAIGRAIVSPNEGPSVYESRGIIVI